MQSTHILNLISSEPSSYVANTSTVSADQLACFTRFRDLELQAYLQRTPSAAQVIELLRSHGGRIVNDHVALRCFQDRAGAGGLEELEKVFLNFGYQREDKIQIGALLLDCYWYEPPEATNWPKVFISELQVSHLPPEAQECIWEVIGDYYTRGPVSQKVLQDPQQLFELLETPPWNPSSTQYDRLLALAGDHPELNNALQYAAWTLIHAHRWNHFTVLLNDLGLDQFQKLEDLNAWIKDHGFAMNQFGSSEIQGAEEKLLKQSSTVADPCTHRFADGVTRSVPGAFVEFIERFPGMRGFLAGNAKGIFTSTNVKQN